MIYEVEVEGRQVAVSVRAAPDGGWLVKVGDGPEELVRGQRSDRAEWLLELDGRRRSVGCHLHGDHATAQVDGYALRLHVTDPRDKALHAAGGAHQGDVSTPMPGVVVRLPFAVGAAVAKGDVVVVVEAMKMENEYKSPVDGVIRAIHVATGQAVEANTVLVAIEAAT